MLLQIALCNACYFMAFTVFFLYRAKKANQEAYDELFHRYMAIQNLRAIENEQKRVEISRLREVVASLRDLKSEEKNG